MYTPPVHKNSTSRVTICPLSPYASVGSELLQPYTRRGRMNRKNYFKESWLRHEPCRYRSGGGRRGHIGTRTWAGRKCQVESFLVARHSKVNAPFLSLSNVTNCFQFKEQGLLK